MKLQTTQQGNIMDHCHQRQRGQDVHSNQPTCLCDVINEKSANSSAIIGVGNGSISLLSSSVPNLRLNRFGIHLSKNIRYLTIDSTQASGGYLDATRGEFDANRRFGFQRELVSREAT